MELSFRIVRYSKRIQLIFTVHGTLRQQCYSSVRFLRLSDDPLHLRIAGSPQDFTGAAGLHPALSVSDIEPIEWPHSWVRVSGSPGEGGDDDDDVDSDSEYSDRKGR